MIILYVVTYLYLGFLFATSSDYKKKEVLDYLAFFMIIVLFPVFFLSLSWIALIKTIQKAAND
jgi:membrane protein DedA with SNARE-associated domain